MKEKNKKEDEMPKISIREFIEYYLKKYKKLSSVDLTIMIHSISRSPLSFRSLQSYISSLLTQLKKQGKVKRVDTKQWLWIQETTDDDFLISRICEKHSPTTE